MSTHFSVFRSPIEGDTPSPNTTLGRLRLLPDPVVYWDCTSLGAFTFASILPPLTHATRFRRPFAPNILLLLDRCHPAIFSRNLVARVCNKVAR